MLLELNQLALVAPDGVQFISKNALDLHESTFWASAYLYFLPFFPSIRLTHIRT